MMSTAHVSCILAGPFWKVIIFKGSYAVVMRIHRYLTPSTSAISHHTVYITLPCHLHLCLYMHLTLLFCITIVAAQHESWLSHLLVRPQARQLYRPSLPVPQMYAPPVTSSVCSEHSKLLAMQCSFSQEEGQIAKLDHLGAHWTDKA